MKKIHVLLAVLLLTGFELSATHIVSGHLSAEALGKGRYFVTLNVRRPCDPQAISLPSDLDMCVYDAQQGLPVSVKNLSQTSVADDKDCYGNCFKKHVYSGVIQLIDSPATNYRLRVQMCCRVEMGSISNDQNGIPYQGVTFEMFIRTGRPLKQLIDFVPSTITAELGNLDSIQINPINYDSDSVVFKLSPLTSGASLSDNYPGCSDTYVPAPDLTYRVGFNASKPLGVNGVLRFNPKGNFIVFQTVAQGFYPIGLKIERWVNDTLFYSKNFEILVNSLHKKVYKKTVTLFGAKHGQDTFALNWSLDCVNNIQSEQLMKSFDDSLSMDSLYETIGNKRTFNDLDIIKYRKMYYRVRVLSGSDTIYSNWVNTEFWNVSVEGPGREAVVQIYPQPVDPGRRITVTAAAGFQSMVLRDINGRVCLRENFDRVTSRTFDAFSIAPGIYLIEIGLPDAGIMVKKLIVE